MIQNSYYFLSDSLKHHRDLKSSLDQKASFLSGFAGIIFTLSIGRLDEIHFLVLAISSFLTAIISIFAVFLPLRSKMKKNLSLMCWWGFSNGDFNQYQKRLYEAFASDKATGKEYMKEIWNLADYSIKPKTKLLKLASLILVIGLLAGFILFFI